MIAGGREGEGGGGGRTVGERGQQHPVVISPMTQALATVIAP